MKKKCLLCTAVVESGYKFYDHLEDVHMMPIRRERIVQPENWIHRTYNPIQQQQYIINISSS
jgi:hypothetical protein